MCINVVHPAGSAISAGSWARGTESPTRVTIGRCDIDPLGPAKHSANIKKLRQIISRHPDTLRPAMRVSIIPCDLDAPGSGMHSAHIKELRYLISRDPDKLRPATRVTIHPCDLDTLGPGSHSANIK